LKPWRDIFSAGIIEGLRQVQGLSEPEKNSIWLSMLESNEVAPL
jgi:hypothetical protein